MILNRLPILNTPLGSAIRRVAASILAVIGVVTIIVLVYRGEAPDITSPEILRQVYGCYYLDGRLALVLSPNGMAHVSGSTIKFSVVSLKDDLNIKPERKLVATLEHDRIRRVHVADGSPLYLTLRLAANPIINIRMLNSSSFASLQKGSCHGN
jgi:hypothetical protein